VRKKKRRNTIMWQAIAVVGGLGVLFGVFLTYFHIKFHVEENPLISAIYELLPKANCGACGYAGCAVFAEALAEGKTEIEKCTGVDSENFPRICRLLGMEEKTKVKMTARVLCSGGNNVAKRFEFTTLKDCRALNSLFDTVSECMYGCIGLGSCAKVCPFDAIEMVENDLPQIDKNKCVGCGKCAEICPKNIIKIVSFEKEIYIACSSKDKGAVVIKICKIGCIGCGKCVKTCPENAIKLEDNVAVIDYDKCNNCEKCVDECPRKVIFVASVKEGQLA